MSSALALVCLAAFLLMLGLSVVFPVLPFFVRSLGMSEFDQGLLISCYALASFLTGPLWGRVSERIGRKPVLCVGLAGFSLAFVLFALGDTFWELVAARTLGGLLAGAAQPAIFAFAADVSTPERRSAAMGMVGAAIGIGVVTGPVLGGLLAPFGLRVPFFTTAAIGAAALVAVVLFVPESLPRGARTSGSAAPRAGARRVAPFLGVSLLSQTGRMSLESTVGFLVADRVAGDARAVGLLLGAVGLLAVAVQGGGLRALNRRFSDRALLGAGTALLALGLCALGFAASWPAIFGASALAAVGSAVATPTLLAELSRAAPAAQGEAQGLNSSALSLGRVLGPLLFTALYQASPGALPYLVAGAVVSGALVCAKQIPRGD